MNRSALVKIMPDEPAEGVGDAAGIAAAMQELAESVGQLCVDQHATHIVKFSGETNTRTLKDWREDIERCRLSFKGDELLLLLL